MNAIVKEVGPFDSNKHGAKATVTFECGHKMRLSRTHLEQGYAAGKATCVECMIAKRKK